MSFMVVASAPIKFLLVDDHEENLVALEGLLQRDGLELLKAHSADEALEHLLVNDVALAFVDVRMPDMDGFALAELMRGAERSRHVPIIFVTAAQDEQHRVFRGYEAGAVDFLFKPIEPRILLQKAEIFFQLHKQRQQLEETLRLNETFIAAVGHDLRNPLDALVLGADLILSSTKEDLTRRSAERMRSSGKRMARIIDDLFDLSRARLGGGIPIERQRIDAVQVAKKVLHEHETTHPDRTLRFFCDGNAEGDWDATRFEQIVANLVGNALRHGATEVPVTLSIRGERDEVILSVHNGGEIPPQVLPTIFDPFRSASARSHARVGLGLGLYIVQQIALAHGGKVDVQTGAREGTTFSVCLPRHAKPRV